jgi:NADH dehydrogenase [ubiquinone] 1 alpha subcomplex assembly factor 5
MFEQALINRLADIRRTDFENALWVGHGDSNAIKNLKTIQNLEIRDVCTEGAHEHFPHPQAHFDLIIINGMLHTINDLPGVLIQIRRALKPDGIFLCALPGGETLHELRATLARVEEKHTGGAAPRIHPMIDLQTMAALMQRAGFALPVVDTEIRTIYYRALTTLLKDIKTSGEGLALNARHTQYVGKTFWPAVETDYKASHASHDGLLMASFEVLYAIGWAPADTQQKPLKPGSAKNRLADALGTTENLI